MEKSKKKRMLNRVMAFVLAILFTLNVPTNVVHAEENVNGHLSDIEVSVVNKADRYNVWSVRPLTTLFDCEIIMALSATEGLVMSFTTSCLGDASVIGVKDIKVQQKMWYGWKTVYISDGGEIYDRAIFAADLVYPDAIKDKTSRVTCTHYADLDGYEEVVNDTGAFQFTY